ncbi:MAG: heat-inducible transcription repressor HrcA [Pelagibacterales bacterium]|nr:heat-inducible transcription repressor HrcA [Pelagibacterales bacterium]
MNSDLEKINDVGDRARIILSEIVESYLNKGTPVSSKIISANLNSFLSPSTVRLIMSNLEEKGFLYSPHTSSGRIPTDKGLKFFVDGILEIGDLTSDERDSIQAKCSVAGKTLMEVLDHSSKELSGLSSCTSLVFAPNNIDLPLKHVEFVPMDNNRALVITIDINGLVENKLIELPSGFTSSSLIEASNYINSKTYGRTLKEVKSIINDELKQKSSEVETLSEKLVSAGIAVKSQEKEDPHFLINRRDFFYGKINQKEDIKKLDVLLNEIQDKKNFINILQYTLKGMGVHVFIGSNTKVFNLAGCSMIIAPLKRNSKTVKPNTLGAIGVIGPSRLNYARIIPMVDFTAKVLNKFLG